MDLITTNFPISYGDGPNVIFHQNSQQLQTLYKVRAFNSAWDSKDIVIFLL